MLKAVLAVVLCFCMLTPAVAFASETEVTYDSVADYVMTAEEVLLGKKEA